MPPVNQTPSSTENQPQKQSHTPVGPTVGIVIIVLLLLVGALYFWGQQLNKADHNPPSYIPGDTNIKTGK